MPSPTPLRRIAVIGGGIAGVGCAWSLHRAGLEPTILEREAEVGGNAKTFAWQVEHRTVTTGLSVLAWPERYFHNYGCLLGELRIATEATPTLRFFVKSGADVYAHGLDTAASERFELELQRWERVVRAIRRSNALFAGRWAGEPGSLYDMSPLNPLHFVRLRDVTRVIGISREFWERVFVPIHSSSFLSGHLDAVPASIAPVLEDVVSLRHGGRLRTWTNSSREVFSEMSRGFAERVHRDRRAVRVQRSPDDVEIADARGGSARYDAVVFACNAHDALSMLEGGDGARWAERALLGGIEYADELDATFLHGVIHSDVTVLPDAQRAAILEGFANYVERFEEPGGARYENTFVLSSWVPAARGSSRPMMVSYNRRTPVNKPAGAVKNERAHPSLTPANLARAFLLRAIQGRHRTFYCGSFSTPGNGHDLSLLSGLVIADALGAPYPFADHPAAQADFRRLRRFMLGR